MHRYISIEETEFRNLEEWANAGRRQGISVNFEQTAQGKLVRVTNIQESSPYLNDKLKCLFDEYARTVENIKAHEASEFEKRNTANTRALQAELELSSYKTLTDDNEAEIASLRKRLKPLVWYCAISGFLVGVMGAIIIDNIL